MDDAFFKLAYAGCKRATSTRATNDVIHAIRGSYHSDASKHRQGGPPAVILFPPLKHVGFGTPGVHRDARVEGVAGVPKFDFFTFPAEGTTHST